ncbi:putative Carboxylic ester hydrolase [Seiridium unicorne]|uniref:Carboxylic ester hydrolase n=1 Tax=Seiridium unicorne TaxID=138068 RepID=A0ABR2UM83_9PEZI
MAEGDVSLIQTSKVSLEVPDLGTVEGLCFDGKTSQYLGIPYAEIPGRFRRPKPASKPWPGKLWDGTKFGPYHPQPPRDFYPIPVPERPWANVPTTSETSCLNLNISVPSRPQDNRKPMPVMIFLHGGAFTYAAGSAAMYDSRVLADSSRDEGIPTIIVTINYRLGVFGFLASKEIQDYNQKFGESGVGNYGIWDQVEALRWVQNHIAAFGGDAGRVTLFGQSAGSVSVNIHLSRDEPLFSSAIMQSGLMPLCGIMSIDQYQVIYEKTLQVLGISEDLSPEERLEELLQIDESRLTASMMDVFITPVITLGLCDDGVLHEGPMPSWSDFGGFKAPAWCPRVMIGDAANECIIWNKAFRHMGYEDYVKQGARLIGEANALQLFEIYGITEKLTHSELFEAIEKFTTDGMYLAANYDAIRAYPQCYAYHFDEPSPYENEWGGLAHHSLENVFIWAVLRHTLPPSQKEQSKRMTGLWLKFASGANPWDQFGEEGNMMVFSQGRADLVNEELDQNRGYKRWHQIRDLGLSEAFGKFADDICIRRYDILDVNFAPKAMEVTKDPIPSTGGVLNIL